MLTIARNQDEQASLIGIADSNGQHYAEVRNDILYVKFSDREYSMEELANLERAAKQVVNNATEHMEGFEDLKEVHIDDFNPLREALK